MAITPAESSGSGISGEILTDADVITEIYDGLGITDVIERFGLKLPISDTDP
jgi:hypothetical protein